MKVGSDSPVKTGAAIVLAVIALLMLGRMIWSSQQATPTATTAGTAKPNGRSTINSIDPTLRTDLLKSSESVEYKGEGKNIFRAEPEAPKELPKPTTPVMTQQQQPVGPPPKPPINLKFFGFANRPGEAKKIFLSQGDDIFIAAEGDMVKSRYKIIRINATSVEVEDVLSNYRQSIPLTQG